MLLKKGHVWVGCGVGALGANIKIIYFVCLTVRLLVAMTSLCAPALSSLSSLLSISLFSASANFSLCFPFCLSPVPCTTTPSPRCSRNRRSERGEALTELLLQKLKVG